MKVVDIADEIYRELDFPTTPVLPAIVFWLTSNIGKLNILIATSIEVDNNEFFPELDDSQKEILKTLYYVYYFSKLMRASLGAAAYDWSEVIEGDTQIRRVSKNEVAKNYYSLKKDLQTEVDDLVFYYKQNLCLPASFSAYADIYQYYRNG